MLYRGVINILTLSVVVEVGLTQACNIQGCVNSTCSDNGTCTYGCNECYIDHGSGKCDSCDYGLFISGTCYRDYSQKNVSGTVCRRCDLPNHCKTCDFRGECDSCEEGWTGYKTCDKRCPEGCKTKNCTMGGSCGNEGNCKYGFYTHFCWPCSKGCQNGYCYGLRGRCTCRNGYDGPSCRECKTGHVGDDCEKCAVGYYEQLNDQNVTACESCFWRCHTCSSRYSCTQCDSRFYGPDCDKSCPTNCKQNVYNFTPLQRCRRDNGTCFSCYSGYSGDRCCLQGPGCKICSSDTVCSVCQDGLFGAMCNETCDRKKGLCPEDSGTTSGHSGVSGDAAMVAVLSVGTTLLFVAIVVAVVFIVRSQRRKSQRTQPNNSAIPSTQKAYYNNTYAEHTGS